MPKKIKIEAVAFACSICKRNYENNFLASECEKDCKIKKISGDVCKKATSISHYEELLSKAFPFIAISFSNLKLGDAWCDRRSGMEPSFIGTITFESSKKDGLYKFNRDKVIGLKLGTGGGSHDKVKQDCYIFIKDLPKVLKNFEKRSALLVEKEKESDLWNDRDNDRIRWYDETAINNKEIKKLKVDKESLYEKIKEIDKRMYEIKTEIQEQSYQKFPELPTPIAYQVENLMNIILCGEEVPEEDYDGLLY